VPAHYTALPVNDSTFSQAVLLLTEEKLQEKTEIKIFVIVIH